MGILFVVDIDLYYYLFFFVVAICKKEKAQLTASFVLTMGGGGSKEQKQALKDAGKTAKKKKAADLSNLGKGSAVVVNLFAAANGRWHASNWRPVVGQGAEWEDQSDDSETMMLLALISGHKGHRPGGIRRSLHSGSYSQFFFVCCVCLFVSFD